MIIGRNTTAPASSHILGNGNRLCDSIGATLPASPPQRAIIVGAEMHTSFTGDGIVDLSLYDVTDYPIDNGAPMVALATLNIPNSNAFAFRTAVIDIDLAAYAGRNLKPAIGNPRGAATTIRVNRVPGGSASHMAAGPLPATWTGTANDTTIEPIIYFETEDMAVGPSFTSITDPIDSSISGTVSEPVTATHYRVSAGGTSANIEIPGGPITGTSFAVTGIDRENLPFIANAADTGAPATVSLTNEEVVVVSTTADLVTAAGTTAHIVTNPDLSSAHSIFNPLYCDTTPEDGQDQFWYTGDPGVSIAANGEVTGEGGFTLQAWDKSALLRGAIASYTISGGVIYPRSPVGRSPVGVSPIGKSPKGIAA